MKKILLVSLVFLSFFPAIVLAQREKAASIKKIEVKKEIFQNKFIRGLENVAPAKITTVPAPKASSPTPGGGPISTPCEGEPEGKAVEDGGKCGDGVCEDNEYHPLYPPLITSKSGEQYYIYGICKERCAKDCGLLCPGTQQYVWDMDECKPVATYVETKCKIQSNLYHVDFILSANYPTVFFLCNDEQKSVKFDISSFISVVGKKVIFNYGNGVSVEFIPQKDGILISSSDGSKEFINSLGLSLYDEASGTEWACWDLQELDMKNKELCLEYLVFPGYYNHELNLAAIDLPELRYFVRKQ